MEANRKAHGLFREIEVTRLMKFKRLRLLGFTVDESINILYLIDEQRALTLLHIEAVKISEMERAQKKPASPKLPVYVTHKRDIESEFN